MVSAATTTLGPMLMTTSAEPCVGSETDLMFFFFLSFPAFQGARGLPGERGRGGASGAAVSAHGRKDTPTALRQVLTHHVE